MRKKLLAVLLIMAMTVGMISVSGPIAVRAGEASTGVTNTIGPGIAVMKDGSLMMWATYRMSGDWEPRAYSFTFGYEPEKVLADWGPVSQVSVGDDTLAVVLSDGRLIMDGANYSGQRGVDPADLPSGSDPNVVLLKDVKEACTAGQVTAAITGDGGLYTWGNASGGRLGDGSTSNRSYPTQVLDHVMCVSVSGDNLAAVTEDGSLYLWGRNNAHQFEFAMLENEILPAQFEKPVKVMDDVKYVSTNGGTIAAVKKDGTLWTWGENSNAMCGKGTNGTEDGEQYITEPVKILDQVTQVALGASHGTALTEDGSVYTWGQGNSGELGNGKYSSGDGKVGEWVYHLTPQRILSGMVQITDSSALTKDGDLYIWGTAPLGTMIGDVYSDYANFQTKPRKALSGVATGGATTAKSADDEKLAAPKLKKIANTAAGIRVYWDKVAGATHYQIFRKPLDGTNTKWKKIASVFATKTAYTDKTLKSSSSLYQYTVRALKKKADGTYVIGKFSNKLTYARLTVPVISKKVSSATVMWSSVTGTSKYYFQYSTDASFKTKKTSSTSGNSIKLNTLESGKTYYFRVRSASIRTVSASETNYYYSPWSEVISFTAP